MITAYSLLFPPSNLQMRLVTGLAREPCPMLAWREGTLPTRGQFSKSYLVQLGPQLYFQWDVWLKD